MNSKKLNKFFNKIIIVLIILIISAFTKEKIFEKQQKDIETEISTITDSNLEIYFLDVGQADSIFIRENDYTMLIDGGNKADGENLVEFLKNELYINDIDILIGTHPHEDHIGGLPNVINSFEIEKIYLPNATTTTKIFECLLNSIEENNYKITVPKIGEEIKLNNMMFKVLYTGTDETDLNNASIVLKLEYGNTSYLFTGDATETTEKKLLSSDISADVLKIGHHGSSYSTTEKFLDKVNPKYAIIEVGKDNKYGHPTKKTIDKLNEKNIEIFRTDLDGTIKITSDGKTLNIETLETELDGD